MLDLKKLANQQLLTTTNAVQIVTNPNLKKTVILTVRVKNNGSNYVAVSLYQVPANSGAVGSLNETAHKFSEVLLYPTGQHGSENYFEDKINLDNQNDSFWIKVSQANVINCSIDGLQN